MVKLSELETGMGWNCHEICMSNQQFSGEEWDGMGTLFGGRGKWSETLSSISVIALHYFFNRGKRNSRPQMFVCLNGYTKDKNTHQFRCPCNPGNFLN